MPPKAWLGGLLALLSAEILSDIPRVHNTLITIKHSIVQVKKFCLDFRATSECCLPYEAISIASKLVNERGRHPAQKGIQHLSIALISLRPQIEWMWGTTTSISTLLQ